MSRKGYICMKCGETALFAKKPSYCPFCGSEDFRINDLEARKHAKEVVEEMKQIVPELEKAWTAYIAVYVEFENRRRLMESYAGRGIIDKRDIPVAEKKKLIDALYEHRAKRRKENETYKVGKRD